MFLFKNKMMWKNKKKALKHKLQKKKARSKMHTSKSPNKSRHPDDRIGKRNLFFSLKHLNCIPFCEHILFMPCVWLEDVWNWTYYNNLHFLLLLFSTVFISLYVHVAFLYWLLTLFSFYLSIVVVVWAEKNENLYKL